MSALEIVLYALLGIVALVCVIKTIRKAIRIKKEKKNGTYKVNEDEEL